MWYFPPNLSQVYVDWLSNWSMTRSLDNIKGLHFSNFKYKLSYLSISHPFFSCYEITLFFLSLFSTIPVIVGSSPSSLDRLAHLITGSSFISFLSFSSFHFFLFYSQFIFSFFYYFCKISLIDFFFLIYISSFLRIQLGTSYCVLNCSLMFLTCSSLIFPDILDCSSLMFLDHFDCSSLVFSWLFWCSLNIKDESLSISLDSFLSSVLFFYFYFYFILCYLAYTLYTHSCNLYKSYLPLPPGGPKNLFNILGHQVAGETFDPVECVCVCTGWWSLFTTFVSFHSSSIYSLSLPVQLLLLFFPCRSSTVKEGELSRHPSIFHRFLVIQLLQNWYFLKIIN